MPKIDIATISAQRLGSYPKQFAAVIARREKQRLGDAVGLTQFGVNITASSRVQARHCGTGTSMRTNSST